jgi:hypothetical protein
MTMDKKAIAKKLLGTLGRTSLTPERLFEEAGVQEQDARDVLSSLIDDGMVVVGRGWVLRLSKNASVVTDAHA